MSKMLNKRYLTRKNPHPGTDYDTEDPTRVPGLRSKHGIDG
jgi:hypothetical protein